MTSNPGPMFALEHGARMVNCVVAMFGDLVSSRAQKNREKWCWGEDVVVVRGEQCESASRYRSQAPNNFGGVCVDSMALG